MQLYLVFLAAAGSARSLKIAVLLRRVYGVGSSRKFTVMLPMVMSAALYNPLPGAKAMAQSSKTTSSSSGSGVEDHAGGAAGSGVSQPTHCSEGRCSKGGVKCI